MRKEGRALNRFCSAGPIALIVALFLMQSCSGRLLADDSETVEIVNSGTPISGVEGFEIQYAGLKPREMPFFDVGYAIWANYPYFTYAGDTYERAGVGGVIIRRKVLRPTRYLVIEAVGEANPFFGTPRESTLTIMDKEKHLVVAHRTLREGEVEHQMGWVGQHAAEFVRRNLQTDDPIGIGGVGTKVYPRVPSTIEALETAPTIATESGCGSTISLSTGKSPATLDTPRWQFLPQAPISDYACSNGYILVLSGIFPNDLFLNVLTEDGAYVFQTELLNPAWIKSVGDDVTLQGVSLSKLSAEFNLLVSKPVVNGSKKELHLEHFAHVRVPIQSHVVQ